MIQPDSGFTFKTRERLGGKIFINITHHPLIERPEQKEIVDFDVIFLFPPNHKNEEGIRIPMSMGEVREEFDKSNKPCKVIDVIINPEICSELQKQTGLELLRFFKELLVSYVAQKHKIELNPNGRFLELWLTYWQTSDYPN